MRYRGFGVAWVAGLSLLSGCAVPPATCPLQIAADFPVTFLHGGAAVVTIHIDHRDFRMLVDSGSTDSYLTMAAYQRLSGDVRSEARIESYSTGLGGTTQENFAFSEDADLGGAVLKGQMFLVNERILPSGRDGKQADGILGNDILHQFNVAYDFPDRRITLFYLQHCAIGETPWAGNYDTEAITENHETLTQTIPYSIDGQTLAMILDSGANVTLVKRSALADHHVIAAAAPAGAAVGLMGSGQHGFIAARERFDSIDVGAESFANAWLLVSNGEEPEMADGLLGDDYLRRHRVFIETDAETAYFGLTVPGS
jgi:predicted aspartyl protease